MGRLSEGRVVEIEERIAAQQKGMTYEQKSADDTRRREVAEMIEKQEAQESIRRSQEWDELHSDRGYMD